MRRFVACPNKPAETFWDPRKVIFPGNRHQDLMIRFLHSNFVSFYTVKIIPNHISVYQSLYLFSKDYIYLSIVPKNSMRLGLFWITSLWWMIGLQFNWWLPKYPKLIHYNLNEKPVGTFQFKSKNVKLSPFIFFLSDDNHLFQIWKN